MPKFETHKLCSSRTRYCAQVVGSIRDAQCAIFPSQHEALAMQVLMNREAAGKPAQRSGWFAVRSVFVFVIGLLSISLTNLAAADDELLDVARRYFEPLPESMPGSEKDTSEQIELGAALYFETALSINNTQSCNTCHLLDGAGAGTDGLSTSPGATGEKGRRNSPTTWNAGLQFLQFWDGRAATLEEQARSPILNSQEMGLQTEAQALQRLVAAGYEEKFRTAYPDQPQPLVFGNILNALGAFQRTLITEDRFDEYLRGDKEVLSTQELRGLKTFVWTGCNACHNGPLLGGNSIMKLGVAKPYPNRDDKGRAEITGRVSDSYFFKVPPLRNVGLTGPYFHDGAVATLEQTVFGTALHQLGVELSDEDVADVSAFLRTLNNRRPAGLSVYPVQ